MAPGLNFEGIGGSVVHYCLSNYLLQGIKLLFGACTGDTICTTIFQCDIGSVPGRNQSLFCCIFLAHYRIQSAVVHNFHLGRSSYMLHRLIRFSCIYAGCMSTALLFCTTVLETWQHGRKLLFCTTVLETW